jgi:hypothetical protein
MIRSRPAANAAEIEANTASIGRKIPNGHRQRTQTFGTEAASYAKQQFSHFADDLSANERAILQRVRAFMETKVQPSRCST